MEKQVKVTLVKSVISSLPKQRATMKALGLRKINDFKIFTDSATLQGQINVVSHLVKVEEV